MSDCQSRVHRSVACSLASTARPERAATALLGSPGTQAGTRAHGTRQAAGGRRQARGRREVGGACAHASERARTPGAARARVRA